MRRQQQREVAGLGIMGTPFGMRVEQKPGGIGAPMSDFYYHNHVFK